MIQPVSPSITIIVVSADDHDAFAELALDQRRHSSMGIETFPLRSRCYLDTFLMKATRSDLGVLRLADDVDDEGEKLITCVLDKGTVLEVLPDLEAMVETNAEGTARALCEYAGEGANLARITAALKSGTWPTSGDSAEEAAAFAYHLLKSARDGKQFQMGVCWEYRGDVKVSPTKRSAS